ncbi:MAG: hypothetical protein LQ346_008745 [Caloplaca aetnensis]|nr:MAG: hypothetical protein LQ346_008745 [Caloplaca aetnensis]
MSLYQDTGRKEDRGTQTKYYVSDNDKRSGPAGSLSKPFTGQALAASPSESPLPQTLHITVSTAHGIPTTLAAFENPQENACYHVYTQTVYAPHISFFAAGHDSEAEEIATATISDKGDHVTCVIRQKTTVSVKPKGKFSSSLLATISAPLGDNKASTEIIWKGDTQSLHCTDASNGTELLSVQMGKPSKKDDWVVKGTCAFGDGAMGMGDELREALLHEKIKAGRVR